MDRMLRLPRPCAALSLLLASCASAPATEERRFDVVQRFEVEVPAGAERVQAWFALPDDRDELQTVESLEHALEAPLAARVETREVRDRLGNRFLFLAVEGGAGGKLAVQSSFRLARRAIEVRAEPGDTRPLTPDERERMAPYLAESTNVVATPEIRARAAEVVGEERNPLVQARLLYDWVLGHVQYWVKDPERWKASTMGSSAYCYENGTGNCTDFHSLYSAAANAVGLPNRIVYGSFLKAPLDGQDTDQSYHCWIEFFAPDLGWIPLDVAVADVFVDDFALDEGNRSKVDLTVAAGYHGPDAGLVDFYFGCLEARRVTWNRGRDLVLDPPAAAGPVNALPRAHVEADGAPITTWTRKLTFKELH